MAGRWLSAEELVKCANLHQSDINLPQRGGVKDNAPDGSWLQDIKLKVFHDERRDALSEERIRKCGALAIGEWRPDLGKVELLQKVGKFWKDMGHEEKGQKLLNCEEALFLMDEGQLEIRYGGIPWSLQQAYGVLLGPELPVEHYQVYAHLSRLGYIVHRFTDYLQRGSAHEQQLRLHKYARKRDKKKNRQKRKLVKDDPGSKNLQDLEEKKAKIDMSQSNPVKMEGGSTGHKKVAMSESPLTLEKDEIIENTEMEVTDSGGTVVEETNSEEGESNVCVSWGGPLSLFESETCGHRMWYSSVQNKRLNDSSVLNEHSSVTCSEMMDKSQIYYRDGNVHIPRYSKWDFDAIVFPNIAGRCDLDLPVPSVSLLPPGVNISQDDAKNRTVEDTPMVQHDTDRSMESAMLSGRSVKCSACNWGDYKEKMAQLSNRDHLEMSAVGHLWRGDVQPLVSPVDALSTEAILDKLKIIKNVGPSDLKPTERKPSTISEVPLVYVVYQPDAKFAKTNPGKPAFRVCITRQDSPYPDLATKAEKWRLCADDANVQWAVVDHGDVAFYSFNPVDLPRDICKQWT